MMNYKLTIGDVKVHKGKATFTCHGLGSCIGLFIQDRTTGLAGGAHIFLPDTSHERQTEENKFYCVTSALNQLLTQFETNGSDLTCLRAKVTGGANVLKLGMQIGYINAQATISQLNTNKIFIAATDLGGQYSRTVHFSTLTGELTVKKLEINEIKFY